jgi:hypothetical protein
MDVKEIVARMRIEFTWIRIGTIDSCKHDYEHSGSTTGEEFD